MSFESRQRLRATVGISREFNMDISNSMSSSSSSSPDSLDDFGDLATDQHNGANGSRENVRNIEQTSSFLKLPVDIFRCVVDYLDGDAAWALKRTCKGMSRSETLNALLYKYTIRDDQINELRKVDWDYRHAGEERWNAFQNSINDSNRHYVQKLAMSHWASIADFQWIEKNLPNLTSMDLSSIKDFMWTPGEIWTWKDLAEACPVLFGRLQELEVFSWADYGSHARIEYSYAYDDYRCKPKFRLCRRAGGGSVAKMIFPICTKLETLGIRERFCSYASWNEYEVHQRVCCMIDGIASNCPATLTRLRLHDYGPYKSLFFTDAASWSNLTEVELDLYDFLDNHRQERDIYSQSPYRIAPGAHHRDEEEAFDDKTYDACDREHMGLGNKLLGRGASSFESILEGLQKVKDKYPHINFKPLACHKDLLYEPLNLINIPPRRRFFLSQGNTRLTNPGQDPLSTHEVQSMLRWLCHTMHWKPILIWEKLMSDVFPDNLDAYPETVTRNDIITRVQNMVGTLKSLDIPIRLSLSASAGNASSRYDGYFMFGDHKYFVEEGEGENAVRKEVIAPSQGRCNLSKIAGLVDELIIQYSFQVPNLAGLQRGTRVIEAEKRMMEREKRAWLLFWKRYALKFSNLKKLTVMAPLELYDDWFDRSPDFRELFANEKWEMLDKDGNIHAPKRRPRVRFAQRVLFRLDEEPLRSGEDGSAEEDLESPSIDFEEILPKEPLSRHRFSPLKPRTPESSHKRRANSLSERGFVKKVRFFL